MSSFSPQLAPEIRAACLQGSAEAATTIGRALGLECSLSPGEPTTWNPQQPPPELTGPGLVLALDVGGAGAAIFLAESSGLLPAWYSAPDATGQSKLSTLAQELGMLLLPEANMPLDFQAGKVLDLPAALIRANVSAGAGLMPIAIQSGDKHGVLYVIWPADDYKQLLTESAEPPRSADPLPLTESLAPPVSSAANATAVAAPRSSDLSEALPSLPGYGRSLLKIKLPITVTLASARQPISRITELGPGAIIQFDKPCTEPLELEVGHQKVAIGEAVKVGDKFGLRITAIVLPEERFLSLRPTKKAG